jgi:hypothetical protein
VRQSCPPCQAGHHPRKPALPAATEHAPLPPEQRVTRSVKLDQRATMALAALLRSAVRQASNDGLCGLASRAAAAGIIGTDLGRYGQHRAASSHSENTNTFLKEVGRVPRARTPSQGGCRGEGLGCRLTRRPPAQRTRGPPSGVPSGRAVASRALLAWLYISHPDAGGAAAAAHGVPVRCAPGCMACDAVEREGWRGRRSLQLLAWTRTTAAGSA